MSNSKIICCICVAALFGACKSPYYSIQPAEVTSGSAIDRIYPLPASRPSVDIKKVTIFRAGIVEKLVKRDAVTEFKFANTNSRKKEDDIGISAIGGRTEMYFCEIEAVEQLQRNGDTLKKAVTRGILFSANFSPDDDCLGFGPLYTGNIDKYKDGIKRFTTTHLFRIGRKKTENGEVSFSKKNSPALAFFYSGLPDADQPGIRFSQVVQTSKNKISGINKSLVYDVESIFNDPDALSFLLQKD